MLLFDLKDGYCSRNARLPKRFCCKGIGSDHHLAPSDMTPAPLMVLSALMEECSDWTTWGEVWGRWTGAGGSEVKWITYLAFVLIAVSSFVHVKPLPDR